MTICDLHCDLLYYLAIDPKHTDEDLIVRCAHSQLKSGGVGLQTMAIFAETGKDSSVTGEKEFACYLSLSESKWKRLTKPEFSPDEKRISHFYAIENASALIEEDEPLELVFKRLDMMRKRAGAPPLYIIMTWNTENRFGGGNLAPGIGLKPDGKALLEYMSGKGIAIDLSHTSDALAHDILSTIDKNKLKVTPLASHSNFREVTNHARNLPLELAQEIAKHRGVIGLNLVRPFIGIPFEEHLRKQVEYAVKHNLASSLVFGADFFYDDVDIASVNRPFFEEGYDTSACYPKILSLLPAVPGLPNANFKNYLKTVQW